MASAQISPAPLWRRMLAGALDAAIAAAVVRVSRLLLGVRAGGQQPTIEIAVDRDRAHSP